MLLVYKPRSTFHPETRTDASLLPFPPTRLAPVLPTGTSRSHIYSPARNTPQSPPSAHPATASDHSRPNGMDSRNTSPASALLHSTTTPTRPPSAATTPRSTPIQPTPTSIAASLPLATPPQPMPNSHPSTNSTASLNHSRSATALPVP